MDNATIERGSRVTPSYGFPARAWPFALDILRFSVWFLVGFLFLLFVDDVHSCCDFGGWRIHEYGIVNEHLVCRSPEAKKNRDQKRYASNAHHLLIGIRHQGRDERFRVLYDCCHDFILPLQGYGVLRYRQGHYPFDGALFLPWSRLRNGTLTSKPITQSQRCQGFRTTK